jgi:hypothetical protein
MDLAALTTPYAPLYLARECWQAARYLVVRHRVHREWAWRETLRIMHDGEVRLSHMCPLHYLPEGGEARGRLELRKYGSPLWCGCLVTREHYGYNWRSNWKSDWRNDW